MEGSGDYAEHKVTTRIDIPFKTEKEAEIAYHVLRVEKEPKRSGVVKTLAVNGNILSANFTADCTRQIRVAVNGYYDNVLLINETMDFAGPIISDKYSYD